MKRVPGQQVAQAAAAPSKHTTAEAGADDDLRVLSVESPAIFACLAGPAHMLETANEAFFALAGGKARVSTGLPLGQLMPELVEQGFIALLDGVYRTGQAHTGRDVRMMLGEKTNAHEGFFDFTYEPRLDSGGNVMGVRMIGVETTQVKHAQRLTTEHRALLEQIARQVPLTEVLEGMARAIEDLAPEEVLVSVLLADADGRHLRHGAAPSLPEFYNQAIDGIATGEGVGSCGTAAHRRRPVSVTDIATDPFWNDFRLLADKAGLAACWSTPILARDGALLGTFAMYHRQPREPQKADLALARVFADTAALAIERHQAEQARTQAEAREDAARKDLAFLLEASTALTTDLSISQTLSHLAALCVPRLAALCAVDVVEGGQIRRIATAAPTQAQQDLLASCIPVFDAEDDAVARVLKSGTSEIARRPPTGSGPWHDLGVTGYLCVPLADRNTPFGTVSLLFTGEYTLDGHAIALAEELAQRAALAARNARQYTHRQALARDLQAGLLLPDLPAVPGTEVATYYHPAGEGLEIGGDFYDVFPLDDGRWAFLLGDVCGRGAIAATTTALVRHTARAVAPLLGGPADVVKAVNRALAARPSSHGTGFVTLVYGQLTSTLTGLDIELVRAGHTQPLHLDTHRDAWPVDAPGILLGVVPDPAVTPYHLHLKPHESLVIYTDGITEARDQNGELFGDDRLAAAVARTPDGSAAQHVIDQVTQALAAFTGGLSIDDDQAILVLAATDPTATPPGA
ncbi:GAF domain-containing SpoIIE family protein phosphatase [Streptomyces microflavus]|uniref:GAF domain-containing SpoIIE family protein phosphatase n=1 Tax=Streptomyces microflavus TaxID=1919 RepID=UPI0033347EC2